MQVSFQQRVNHDYSHWHCWKITHLDFNTSHRWQTKQYKDRQHVDMSKKIWSWVAFQSSYCRSVVFKGRGITVTQRRLVFVGVTVPELQTWLTIFRTPTIGWSLRKLHYDWHWNYVIKTMPTGHVLLIQQTLNHHLRPWEQTQHRQERSNRYTCPLRRGMATASQPPP